MPHKSTQSAAQQANKKKKIIFVITKSVWGGAQKYVYDLAVNLPKENFEALVAGGPEPEKARSGANRQISLVLRLQEKNIPYFEIKSFQRDINFFKEIFSFFEILNILFKTKPDIIHVSSSKAGGVAGVASFIYKLLAVKPPRGGLTAIFTIHGWAFLEQRPKWQIWFIKIASKITCLFYNKIICVSQNDYNEAIRKKIAPARKMVTIHNGINPADYNFLERTEKEFVVGTIGESVKNKGHEYLTEASKYFSDVKFNILSNVPNASRYLKNFDIFVLPSIKEGLPYVILEAGLAGLPVVASQVGGIPEIIKDGENGLLVPPKNPEALAEAIKKLIADKNMREKLAENLRQKITQEFSLEKMLNATIKVYEK